jgi:hypothetical protein
MDALDARRPKQKLGKKQKQQFAQEKALEELLVPPSKPLAPWLSDPSLLPKKPPGRR